MGPKRFDADIDWRGRQAVVVVEGDLDLATAPLLERALAAAEADEPEALTIDLRGLDFIDSAGLHVVADAGRRAQAARRRFGVVRARPFVAELFRFAGLVQLLDGSGWIP